MSPRSTTRPLCISGALSPIQHSSNDRCPSVRHNELLHPSSLLHRSPLIYFWHFWSHATIFSSFSLYFTHCCFCSGYLHCLRHRNKFVYQIEMLQWIVSSSCDIVLMKTLQRLLHTHSRGFTGFQDTHKFWLEIISVDAGLLFLTFLACLCSIPNGFLQYPCPQGHWNKFLVIF